MSVHLFAILAFLALARPVQSQGTVERQILTPTGGAAGAGFGAAASIGGDVAAFGAQYDGELGLRAGAAFVYRRDPVMGWVQARRLLASDGKAEDFFGHKVLVDGDRVLVSAPGRDGATIDQGAVYVYARDQGGAGQWGELALVTSPTPVAGEKFGSGPCIHGDLLAIGAARNGQGVPGSVFLFQRDALALSGWSVLREIVSHDPSSSFQLGTSVALGDGVLFASGARTNDRAISFVVHVFERDAGGPGAWGETQVIEHPGEPGLDFFGSFLALSGGVLAVPAWEYLLDRNDFGVVYLYERSQDGRFEIRQLLHSELAHAHSMPPQAIAMNADWLAVGTLYEPLGALEDVGTTIVFGRNAGGVGQWGEIAARLPSDPRADGYYGYSLTLDGAELLVGSPGAYFEDQWAGREVAYDLDLAFLARALARNDAHRVNLELFTSTRPLIGQTYVAQVDRSATPHLDCLLLIFANPAEIVLPRGQVQLGQNLLGARESPSGRFELAIPNDLALIGRRYTTQAVLLRGVRPMVLTNALDLVFGAE